MDADKFPLGRTDGHPLRGEIYKVITRQYHIGSALYPGCGYDIVPSLYIPEVVYLDHFKDVANFFRDRERLLNDLSGRKAYSEPCRFSFYKMDYHSPIDLPQFDLLISQYAGNAGQAMKRFLRPGGILLVAEGPEDAELALKDPEYELLGTITGADGKVEIEPGLRPAACFTLSSEWGGGSVPIDRNFCFQKRK